MDALDTLSDPRPPAAAHRAPRRSRGRRASLALVTAATLLAGGAVVGMAPAAHADASDNAGFLAHLNGLRAAHGLPALSVASDLAAIATAHSAAMMVRQTIFHNASLTSEVSNWQVLGENVGMGGSVSAIDTAFDNSPEHYANEISSAYTQVGIGTARDTRGYLYVTLDFRKPASAPPAPKPPAPRPVAPPPAPKPVVAAPPARPASSTPQHSSIGGPASAPAVTAPTHGTASTAAAAPPAASTPPQPAVPTAADAAATAAREAPTVVPVTPTGNDPVATALAFSRFLAELN
ncbi:MAG TPA: CAP domain-containing protein [Mycobacteriales bacterium]